MKHAIQLAASAAALFTAVPARADVRNVGGPTPDHAQIWQAVQAAQDGDVIRVWPGNYASFTVLDKSLALVRAASAGAVTVQGTIRIRNLAAWRSVEFTGIRAIGTDGQALIVSDCAGSVRIRDGVFEGADFTDYFFGGGYDGVYLLNASDVELTACIARGGSPPTCDECGGWGGHGLTMSASNLSAYASTFRGESGHTEYDPGESGSSGGHGIFATGPGRAYVSGCTLIGGDGSDADIDPDPWTGDYGYGGDGGFGFYGYGPGLEPWFLDNTYQPGSAGTAPIPGHHGAPGQPTSGGTNLPGASRTLRSTELVDDATPIGLSFEGAPGDSVYLRIADEPGYAFSNLYGPWLLAAPLPLELTARDPFPPAGGWRFVGTVGANGTLATSFPASELAPFGHRVLHLQAAFAGAETYYGSSSWAVVLDGAW